MYIPDKYQASDWELQKSIIENYPLATLITSNNELIANHIPFNLIERDGKKYLQAHIAKKNHQLPSMDNNDNVLVVFTSHDSYITPAYYATKQETHKVVPTWDFASVHIYGKSQIIDSPEFLRAQHLTLADENEPTINGKKWTVDETPENYYKLLSKAITGLEIEIVKTEGKFKFEQKMKSEDVKGVITGLKSHGKDRVAQFVEDSNAGI